MVIIFADQIADLRDLEEFDEAQHPLYMAALRLHEDGGIPFRYSTISIHLEEQ